MLNNKNLRGYAWGNRNGHLRPAGTRIKPKDSRSCVRKLNMGLNYYFCLAVTKMTERMMWGREGELLGASPHVPGPQGASGRQGAYHRWVAEEAQGPVVPFKRTPGVTTLPKMCHQLGIRTHWWQGHFQTWAQFCLMPFPTVLEILPQAQWISKIFVIYFV